MFLKISTEIGTIISLGHKAPKRKNEKNSNKYGS